MAVMLGLDAQDAAAFVSQKLDWKRFRELRFEMERLCRAMVDAQVDYLHACGALDDSGDTGEGEYDEDEAAEFILERLCAQFLDDDERAVKYCELINEFLPVFDDYLMSAGLLSL